MANHTHTVEMEVGPFCCADNVRYLQLCSCGCERHKCDCTQCFSNFGSHYREWYMPKCDACGLRHPMDESCTK